MTRSDSIEAAVAAAGFRATVCRRQRLSGGCIHHVEAVTLDDGTSLVAKVADAASLDMLEAEGHGLGALAAAGAVAVPTILECGEHAGAAVLLMTHLPSGRAESSAWARFGRELAAQHAVDVGPHYGFDRDNYCGSTPQPNPWCDDWVEFNARHRIGYQVDLAASAGRLFSDEVDRLRRLIDELERHLPRHPKPALLHGDLWSGNAVVSTHESVGAAGSKVVRSQIAVIDPAASIGDGWADIAMMRLFGGFPEVCHRAYLDAATDRDRIEARVAVYQLYHVLNHVNLFGRGYAAQAMSIAARLGV